MKVVENNLKFIVTFQNIFSPILKMNALPKLSRFFLMFICSLVVEGCW